MLKVRDLSKSYGGARPRDVLRGVSLEVRRGEYVAVVGESGVGKSTLLNLVAGLDPPDPGSLPLHGAGPASSRLPKHAKASSRKRSPSGNIACAPTSRPAPAAPTPVPRPMTCCSPRSARALQ